MGNEPTASPLPLRPANLDAIAARGVAVPAYDRSRLTARIAHIGVGGFHRAHLAGYTDELASGGSDWAIGGIGLLAGDAAMAAALGPQEGLYTLVVRDDAAVTPTVIGSIVDYVHAAGDTAPAIARLADPAVAVISMTLTEGGYVPDPRNDATFDVVAAALDQRRGAGHPVTVLSCDNLPGNGDAARAATLAAATRRSAGLADWVERECTFPNSMVDRITPATTDADRDWLAATHGVTDRWPVVAEPFRQWVLEDHFVAGRPSWEDVGATFTSDVAAWELYKLRLLNAAHSCMAYLCAVAGIVYVDEAMRLGEVRGFLEGLLATEAIPSLPPIPGQSRADYAATALHRFENTQIRDQIARLCLDGTSKFPVFLIPTIEEQLAGGRSVRYAALALAGWARYLGTVPESEQAADPDAATARTLAARALDDPSAFLQLERVFPPAVRDDDRFRTAFTSGYAAIAGDGPLAAMAAVVSGGDEDRRESSP